MKYSTTEPSAIVALDDFADRIMRIDQGAERILDAVARSPDDASLHLAATFFWLFGQTPKAQDEADRYLVDVRAAQGRLNPRERAWANGLDLWHRKAFDAAACVFEAITSTWPDDLLALRAAEFLYYVLGQQYSGPRFAAHTERLAHRHADHPDFLAIHAFANELCGRPFLARAHAERAIALRAINPWAQHALAHVVLWEGNDATASTMLDGWLTQWPQVARTVHCHNAWHVALMHMDRLESERAFAVYDEHVWGKTPDYVVEQIDAIAFLWRAEMAGVVVDGARWKAIVPHIIPLCMTLFMPFTTAHYAYALARGGDAKSVHELLRVAQRRASDGDPEALRVWHPVGMGIVRAAAALGAGDARRAVAHFDSAMPDMTRIGGSDAQDDLFRFAYIDSLRRAGRQTDATAFLRDRLAHKQASPLELQLLAQLR
ncbi:MAG: hypothetical protein ABI777_14610 [Betaproteobacteria bacterium]